MIRLIIVCMALTLVISCTKEEQASGGNTQTADKQQVDPNDDGGRSGIGEGDLTEFERSIEAKINPYFDEAGTESAVEVAPGDYFDIYIFAEHNDMFPMSAAEFKLQLPDEISVMSSSQSDSTILSLGTYDVDYMMAFRCVPGGKYWLVKFQCKAHENFQGGTASILRGQNLNFLGYTLCDASKQLIPAAGGTAEIRRKK